MSKRRSLIFSGKVDQVELPDMDFGTSDASEWNVDDLLQVAGEYI